MADSGGTLLERPGTSQTVEAAPPTTASAVTTPQHVTETPQPTRATPREHRNRVIGVTIAIVIAVIAVVAAVYFALIAPVAQTTNMGLSDEAWAQDRAGERATSVVVTPPVLPAGVPHGAVPAELLD